MYYINLIYDLLDTKKKKKKKWLWSIIYGGMNINNIIDKLSKKHAISFFYIIMLNTNLKLFLQHSTCKYRIHLSIQIKV